ncbi:MAG: ATP-binding protein [bacterium]
MVDPEQVPQNTPDVVISANLISPATLLIAALIMFDFFRGATFNDNPVVIFGFVASLTAISLSHFIPKLNFTKDHLAYLILYHGILSITIVLIMPTLSYFLFAWVLLVYLSEYYFPIKGTIISLSTLLGVTLLSQWYQTETLTLNNTLASIPYILTIATLSILLARIMLGNREQRRYLTNKVTEAEYEHQRLIALINSVSEAVIAVNEKGIITLFNAAALDLLDTNIELSGKNLDTVLPLMDEHNNPIDLLKIASETRYIQRRTDMILPIGDSDHVALDINMSRVSMATALHREDGYIFLIRDITQEKSLDEERELFISEVSHELRTPITIAEANISMAVLLANKPDRDKKMLIDGIEKAHKQVLFLADMVNDLSTLSRAQRPDSEMEVATFPVQEITTELLKIYEPQAAKKSLYLKSDIAENLPQVTTSKLYLKEIMQNFITNSIKYTKEGGLTIIAKVKDDHTIEIGVQDTGIGIAKSEIEHVYEKFWRSEDPYTRSTGGTGLGLFITAKLAKRIGATILLESELGKGSLFGLLLPVVTTTPVDQKIVAEDEVTHIIF